MGQSQRNCRIHCYKPWNLSIIVYYALREEKTWTVHISCKLPPEPKARVANTRCGLANFTPVKHILFFVIVSIKSLLCACTAGRKVCTLRILWWKHYFPNTIPIKLFNRFGTFRTLCIWWNPSQISWSTYADVTYHFGIKIFMFYSKKYLHIFFYFFFIIQILCVQQCRKIPKKS